MKLGAVIIDNRQIDLLGVIEKHRAFLPICDIHAITTYPIKSILDYNMIMTSFDFWEEFSVYDRVLIFQHDSGLLRTGIEEFYEWDYVGAPWKFQDHGGNGGLSLRNPRAMINALYHTPYKPMHHGNEDVYFCNVVKQIGNLAPRSVCKKFSVETIFELGTLGYHAMDKYLSVKECQTILNQYK